MTDGKSTLWNTLATLWLKAWGKWWPTDGKSPGIPTRIRLCIQQGFQQLRSRRRAAGRLRLVDSLSLGERRFAGILELEGRRFLIGATSQAVTLLAELRGESGTRTRAETDEVLAIGDGPKTPRGDGDVRLSHRESAA